MHTHKVTRELSSQHAEAMEALRREAAAVAAAAKEAAAREAEVVTTTTTAAEAGTFDEQACNLRFMALRQFIELTRRGAGKPKPWRLTLRRASLVSDFSPYISNTNAL